jgi:BirA family transcriptional regulator, biotin operon repressor / biotin---[acetyl-CoA-carboxylase] ligase
MGRGWESPTGNLFTSTIIRIKPHDPLPSTLAFVAGLAAYDAILTVAPHISIQLKWPNDVLTAQGAKICGILLERVDDAIIAGFGINLRSHPANLDRPVTNLLTLGAAPPVAQDMCEILAEALAKWLKRWRETGQEIVLRNWDAAAHPFGTGLSVNLPVQETVNGEYAGLAADGALKLRLADGQIRAIHAADVFLI